MCVENFITWIQISVQDRNKELSFPFPRRWRRRLLSLLSLASSSSSPFTSSFKIYRKEVQRAREQEWLVEALVATKERRPACLVHTTYQGFSHLKKNSNGYLGLFSLFRLAKTHYIQVSQGLLEFIWTEGYSGLLSFVDFSTVI